MNIAGYAINIKGAFAAKLLAYWRVISIVLLALMCLGVYQIWQAKSVRPPVTVSIGGDAQMNGQATDVYASKTGKKYYFPWCGALSRIKPENRVEFASPALAVAAGYSPAANCKGVK